MCDWINDNSLQEATKQYTSGTSKNRKMMNYPAEAGPDVRNITDVPPAVTDFEKYYYQT